MGELGSLLRCKLKFYLKLSNLYVQGLFWFVLRIHIGVIQSLISEGI